MSSRTILSCYVADCVHHNANRLDCNKDEISITTDKGGLPLCDGYQFNKEYEHKERA